MSKLRLGFNVRPAGLSLEGKLLATIKRLGCLLPVKEFRFHIAEDGQTQRKWKFDYAWPEYKIALEIEGGLFKRGRHSRGTGYVNDCVKYNEAAFQGWIVVRLPRYAKVNRKQDIERLVERIQDRMRKQPRKELFLRW